LATGGYGVDVGVARAARAAEPERRVLLVDGAPRGALAALELAKVGVRAEALPLAEALALPGAHLLVTGERAALDGALWAAAGAGALIRAAQAAACPVVALCLRGWVDPEAPTGAAWPAAEGHEALPAIL